MISKAEHPNFARKKKCLFKGEKRKKGKCDGGQQKGGWEDVSNTASTKKLTSSFKRGRKKRTIAWQSLSPEPRELWKLAGYLYEGNGRRSGSPVHGKSR